MLEEMLDRHFFPHYDILKEFGVDREIILKYVVHELIDYRVGYMWAIRSDGVYVARGISNSNTMVGYGRHTMVNNINYQVNDLTGILTPAGYDANLLILNSKNQIEIDENMHVIKKEKK